MTDFRNCAFTPFNQTGLCDEAISQNNSFKRGKCNSKTRLLQLHNAKWLVGMVFSHSSSLEISVPAKLVSLLVPECAANILITVRIYSYL